MTLRLHTILTGLLALITAALLALAPASANPTSGGYQLFERVASGISTDIQLASLENFDYYAKTASECCIAPNRVATDAEVATNFQQNRQFWSSEPIQFNGNRVYQRNDLIDPNRVDPVSGKTNLELMQAGRAPLGPDGKSINLHHLTQSQSGAIAEVTQTLHSSNHGVLHMPNTVPSGINRTEFNTWRRNYWQNRARDF